LYHALWSYENVDTCEGGVKATLKAIYSFLYLETDLFTMCYACGERLKAVSRTRIIDVVKGILVDNLQAKICAEQKYIVPLSLKLS
jgi:hypothetical protein